MNKHIDQCLYQAGLTAQGCWDELGTYEQEAIERFAELLVRQCAEVGLDSVEDGDDLDVIMKRVHNNILKHFGVEE